MASRDLLLNVDEFYNAWADPFFIRMIVDVRKKDVFTKMQDHASMAVNFDHSSDGSVSEFVKRQVSEEHALVERVIFYDAVPFQLSKPLKRIAELLPTDRKINGKRVFFLEGGSDIVKKKYEFIFQGKEEETAYPSVILDDFLYLGDEECSVDKDVIVNLGITHVLTVLPVSKFSYKFADIGIEYCQCPIQDISTDPINKYFSTAIQFIDGAKSSKETKKARVLVHCMAGVSRSPTIVVVYLIQHFKWSLKEAYSYVLARRSIIHPNEGFLRMLLQFELDILGSQSITLDELENL